MLNDPDRGILVNANQVSAYFLLKKNYVIDLNHSQLCGPRGDWEGAISDHVLHKIKKDPAFIERICLFPYQEIAKYLVHRDNKIAESYEVAITWKHHPLDPIELIQFDYR